MFGFFRKTSQPETPEPNSLRRIIGDVDAMIEQINTRLKNIGLSPTDVANLSDDVLSRKDTTEAQTLRRERVMLLQEREHAQKLLNGPSDTETKRAEQRAKRDKEYLDLREAESRHFIERTIAQHLAAGDHRQAAIWREQLIGLRERIARDELGHGR